jgi:hypothetical protein
MTSDPETAPRPAISRAVLMTLLRQHGGRFHGPNVEHLSMEEDAFWRFMDEVIEIARSRRRLEVL